MTRPEGDPALDSGVVRIRTTSVGSWPGTDMADAVKIAFAECPDLPYLPELPARGTHAQLIGRSTAFLSGLAFDLQPAGWRLTDGSGRDHRLAKDTVRSDLDLLEEHAQGYAGPVKVAVAGPWTLAAMVERPRGDRLLADRGARRELGQSLGEGVLDLVAELRRRLPEVVPLVQLDEPLLPAVLGGRVPTASGFSRHRAVDLPEVSDTIGAIAKRLAAAGTELAVHSCAAGTPIDLLRGAGVRGLLLDLDQLAVRDWDAIGAALDAGGGWFGLGALPTGRAVNADEVARRVLMRLRPLDFDPAWTPQLILCTACGLASATRTDAINALRTLRTAARIVGEQLLD